MATPHERNLEQVSQAELLAEAAEAAPNTACQSVGRRLAAARSQPLGGPRARHRHHFVLTAIFAPLIAPYGEDEVVAVQAQTDEAEWIFPMGIDQNGRDVFSRIVYGARVSLLVGVVAQLIVLDIGVPIGAIAGYYGGQVDNALMRMVDVFYAIPQLLLVLLLVNMLGPGMKNIFIAIGVTGWVNEARLVRGTMLALREQEYVKASKVAGGRGRLHHHAPFLPNSMTPIIVALTFGIPRQSSSRPHSRSSVSASGRRSPSWGQMVGAGQQYIQSVQHLMLFPCIAIGLTMLAFTFLGDGLRDALDVKMND